MSSEQAWFYSVSAIAGSVVLCHLIGLINSIVLRSQELEMEKLKRQSK